ncbi:carboxypeptidase-like regulatory domain-containing protein, partial [Parabacteroides merdae]|uniref:carboxypeptidase-like regulatory domain-containing protein n=1 Tax=Parabacteroides merdae TaxID=46503 RepID=UPI00210B7FD0
MLLWVLLFWGSVSVFAQHAVKGIITDAKTGEPLIGVIVVLRGSSESGTISDMNGNYSLSVPESSSLNFSYIGYVT